MIHQRYKTQVDLLLRVLSYVANDLTFALKGGTAINMFLWDMPRLSVDIDLTYLPLEDRNISLINIADALAVLKDKIKKGIPGIQVEIPQSDTNSAAKLICTLQADQIKIEVNTIMRGHIKPVEVMSLSDIAQKEFDKFIEMQILSQAELFGGKICAALDRQHPRDLFDIHHLFERGEITGAIKDGFLACLLSHNRPINEMLKPNFKNQQNAFTGQFEGMTLRSFSYLDFEIARERLLKEINQVLTEDDKRLLLSFKAGNPDWNLSKIKTLQNLPAIRWKLQNIKKLQQQDPKKHAVMLRKLEGILQCPTELSTD